MSKYKHETIKYLQGFILEQRSELLKDRILERTQHLTIVLENIFQGRNISASIRSADCFGIQDVHIIENDNIFNDDAEVSMGAEKWVTIKRHNQDVHNSTKAIKYLKKQGYQIIATTPYNSNCNLYDLDISKKTALLFGSEVKGCSEETLMHADKKMKIPMYGFTESFNISVAVSLCLQHLTYKMRNSKIDWKLRKEQKEKVMLQWLRNSIKSVEKIEKNYLANKSKE